MVTGYMLLAWYDRHRRDLPWRRTRDPYRIWVAEVILQQTRVVQGTGYYLRFLERFPTVEMLARASEDEVLKVWEGLGYYRRARNMHAAAREVVERWHGRFPSSYEVLLTLPGIGPYTAAAVASIAFGEKVPVVDGNVFRVVTRLHALRLRRGTAGDREVRQRAAAMMPDDRPGDFNQAIMELGALICLPDRPACPVCPLAGHCRALEQNLIGELPPSGPPKRTKKRYFHYFLITCCDRILLRRRGEEDIWQHLHELPLMETEQEEEPAEVIDRMSLLFPPMRGQAVEVSATVRHQLTHRTILARFYRTAVDRLDPLPEGWEAVPREELAEKTFPRLLGLYLEKQRILPGTGG